MDLARSETKSRYELFVEDAKNDIDAYRERLRGDGTFDFCTQVKQLERLSTHLNSAMMVYLFGEHPGRHLAEKFAGECGRNLLYFLSRLTVEYRLFILHELKNNPNIFHQR